MACEGIHGDCGDSPNCGSQIVRISINRQDHVINVRNVYDPNGSRQGARSLCDTKQICSELWNTSVLYKVLIVKLQTKLLQDNQLSEGSSCTL